MNKLCFVLFFCRVENINLMSTGLSGSLYGYTGKYRTRRVVRIVAQGSRLRFTEGNRQ